MCRNSEKKLYSDGKTDVSDWAGWGFSSCAAKLWQSLWFYIRDFSKIRWLLLETARALGWFLGCLKTGKNSKDNKNIYYSMFLKKLFN